MTQLEVPTLQVGRYLELLKRRRWQLLPAAFAGLLVGILVAWLIPRYYEATTIVRLNVSLAKPDRSQPDKDPFIEEISKAKYTIRNYALLRDAVFALGFEDVAAVRDHPDVLRAMLASIKSRISVKDLNRGQRSSAALLMIGYRDKDPERAAALANRLQEIYIQKEQDLVHKRARRMATQLKNEMDLKQKAWKEALDTRTIFLQKNEFNPDEMQRVMQGSKTELLHKRLQELRTKITQRRTVITVLKGKIERSEDLFDQGIPPKTIIVQLSEEDPAVQKLLLPIRQNLRVQQVLLATYTPIHFRHAAIQSTITQLEKQLAAVLAHVRASKGVEEENPQYAVADAALRKDRESLQVNLAQNVGDIKERDALAKTLNRRTSLFSKNRELLTKVTVTEEEWTRATKAYSTQRDYLLSLENNSIYIIDVVERASPPATPTYPNRWLVSLLGAILGLVTSIGLILLLDFMQASWKTLDEVRHGLTIPVLGGISFLELPEENLANRRRRLRYTVVAASFLILVGGVVGVYLVKPVTLPIWVQGVLEKLIG